ncbi:HBL254Wp [Eremothecium sinecaudum]|uniref:Large ribosomal subunit protein uL6m n=1 Tax=Eremothecium sinecaudum TaxID=45286 RepID=A0A109UW31_9SACH|nr:HBL254Wp [Eremothecium sinecaudum]AMD18648.1 HBL254Wp [Eremothecium sinecaudum]
MMSPLIIRRQFSVTSILKSHIGSSPVYLTPKTTITQTALSLPKIVVKGKKVMKFSNSLTVEGPLGSITMDIPDCIKIDHDKSTGRVDVNILDTKDKMQKAMWGTIRSHLNSHVLGVNEGHIATLKLVGTGYRAQLEKDGKFVSLKVGASIMQGLPVPEGITVRSPAPTSLIIEGCHKQQVNLFAANLRKFHPPEPYKGKGIYVNDETIKLKDKKIK